MNRVRRHGDALWAVATENLGFKALSLFVSLAIWSWVQVSLSVERRARATVTYDAGRATPEAIAAASTNAGYPARLVTPAS